MLFDGWKAVERYLIAILLSVDFEFNRVNDDIELAKKLSDLCRRKGKDIGNLAYKFKYSNEEGQNKFSDLSKIHVDDFRDLFFSRDVSCFDFQSGTPSEPSQLIHLHTLKLLVHSVDPSLAFRPWRLIYRATRDGFSVKHMWRKLVQPRDEGTVVIVKLAGQNPRGILWSLFSRFTFEVTAADHGHILATFSRDEVMKFTDSRFFVGGLLLVDGDMKRVDGHLFPSNNDTVILDLEVLVAAN
jgi:hypothetical protein